MTEIVCHARHFLSGIHLPFRRSKEGEVKSKGEEVVKAPLSDCIPTPYSLLLTFHFFLFTHADGHDSGTRKASR